MTRSNTDCIELVCDNITCNNLTSAMISWDDSWVIGLYFVLFLTLSAVLLCIAFIVRNKDSPLMQGSFSTLDYIILTILAIFCILPLAHIIGKFSYRCVILWPILDVIYAFHGALLLSKTIFLQNLLGCQRAMDHPSRRLKLAVFIAILHVSILVASLGIFGPLPTHTRYVCPTSRVVTHCELRGNLGIILAASFNWIALLFLFILTLVELVNNTNDPRRTKNQVGLTFIVLVSFSWLSITTFSKLQVQYYVITTYLYYVIYLINPVISLVSYYFPTIYPIYKCFREQERSHRAIQGIPESHLKSTTENPLLNYTLPRTEFHPAATTFDRAGQMSSHPSTSYTHRRTSFDPRRTTLSWGDVSVASSLSYPSSLAEPDRDFVRVVSRLRKSLDIAHLIENGRGSFYDNATSSRHQGGNRVSAQLSDQGGERFSESNEDEVFTAEELTQMMSFVENLQSTNV